MHTNRTRDHVGPIPCCFTLPVTAETPTHNAPTCPSISSSHVPHPPSRFSQGLFRFQPLWCFLAGEVAGLPLQPPGPGSSSGSSGSGGGGGSSSNGGRRSGGGAHEGGGAALEAGSAPDPHGSSMNGRRDGANGSSGGSGSSSGSGAEPGPAGGIMWATATEAAAAAAAGGAASPVTPIDAVPVAARPWLLAVAAAFLPYYCLDEQVGGMGVHFEPIPLGNSRAARRSRICELLYVTIGRRASLGSAAAGGRVCFGCLLLPRLGSMQLCCCSRSTACLACPTSRQTCVRSQLRAARVPSYVRLSMPPDCPHVRLSTAL